MTFFTKRLGIIQQNLDFTKLSNPSFWRDFHGQVVEQSGNIAKLIGSLTLSQYETKELATGPALPSAIDSNKPQFVEQNVTLRFDTAGPLPSIHSNADIFNQMMSLFLKAELARTSSGGTVSVAAQSKDEGLKLTFTATGTGFSTELLGKVFDPFMMTTEPSEPSALALMGAYFLAYHLGGKISTQHSTAGQVIELTLPAHQATPVSGPESGREFITNVLMNDALWERLLPNG